MCLIVILQVKLDTGCNVYIVGDCSIRVYYSRHLIDPWDNSTLMSYIAPFSGPTLSLGTNTATAIGNMEQHLQAWLQEGFSQHYKQLSFMERLRNEMILLHAKVCTRSKMTNLKL